MRYVLFVCTHNAGRSQMAQAFFERHAPDDLRAESAGQAPAETIWPNVIEAMSEVGIDISARRPKKIDREMQLHADKAITLNCQESCPYVLGGVEDWEVDDPAGQPLENVREIRDDIERRVRDLVENRADEIRSDPSGHQRRLAQLLPSLADEFEGTKSPKRSAPALMRSSASSMTHACARSCSPWHTERCVTVSANQSAPH
jgi:arsenate reductase